MANKKNVTTEEIEVKANLDDFNASTEKILDKWSDVFKVMQDGGKGAIKTHAQLTKYVTRLSDKLRDFTKVKDVFKNLDPKQFAGVSGELDKVSGEISKITKGTGTLKKKSELYNKQLEIANKIIKQSSSGLRAQFQVDDKIRAIKMKTGKLYNAELKAQRDINKATIAKIKNEKKDLTFSQRIAAQIKLQRENFALLAQETTVLGRGMRVLKGGIDAVGKAIQEAFLPLLAIVSIMKILSSLGEAADKARKAASELASAYAEAGVSAKDLTTDVDAFNKTLNTTLSGFGMTLSELTDWNKEIISAGYGAKMSSEQVAQFGITAANLGKSVGEFAGLIVQGWDEMSASFQQSYKDLGNVYEMATKSGLGLTKWYSKAINAASGLSIFNSNTTKSITLWESLRKKLSTTMSADQAAEFAKQLMRGFDDMDLGAQTLTTSLSGMDKTLKDIQDKYANVTEGTKSWNDAAEELGKTFGITTKEARKMMPDFMKAKDAYQRAIMLRGASSDVKARESTKALMVQSLGKQNLSKRVSDIGTAKIREMIELVAGKDKEYSTALTNLLKENQGATLDAVIDKMTTIEKGTLGKGFPSDKQRAKDIISGQKSEMEILGNELANKLGPLGTAIGKFETAVNTFAGVISNFFDFWGSKKVEPGKPTAPGEEIVGMPGLKAPLKVAESQVPIYSPEVTSTYNQPPKVDMGGVTINFTGNVSDATVRAAGYQLAQSVKDGLSHK
jgi:hypothetical protein